MGMSLLEPRTCDWSVRVLWGFCLNHAIEWGSLYLKHGPATGASERFGKFVWALQLNGDLRALGRWRSPFWPPRSPACPGRKCMAHGSPPCRVYARARDTGPGRYLPALSGLC